jgi:hypothetical protein
MRPWLALWRLQAVLLAALVGCGGTSRAVRTDPGARGDILVFHHRSPPVEPVQVSPAETTRALRRLAQEVRLTGSPRETVERLVQLDVLSGDYLFLLREQKLIPLAAGTPLDGAMTEAEQRLLHRYKGWCQSAHGVRGDCLGGALVAGQYLDLQGRYMWAMALSRSPLLEEFEKALGEQVSMRAVMQAAMYTVVTLLVLLSMPEPVTKFIAAWAVAALILWVGAQTLYNVLTGWFQLMEEVKRASTFEELREAGETFGRVFSREAAQAFALIAMALLTHTAKGFSGQVGTLPGSAEVSMRAAGQEGLLLSEVGAVESVTVTAEGFLVAVPPGAVAMAAEGGHGGRTQKHHIATVANKKSALRGGPWTPLFEKLYARAGMRLTDPRNIVPLEGHRGPHPRRYHELVYERLEGALGNCRSIDECRMQLLPALDDLARRISTPGTELNRLVTLGK